MKNTTTILFSLLISITCYAQQAEKNDTTQGKAGEDWKTLNGDKYSIQYPAAWQLDQSHSYGSEFFLFSPLESDKDQFRENVNLIIEDLKGASVSLDQYAELATKQIGNFISKVKFLENEKIKEGAKEHQRVVYTGEQGVYHLAFEQYYWVSGGKAYVLTFTCEENKFPSLREYAESIMNTFVLKK